MASRRDLGECFGLLCALLLRLERRLECRLLLLLFLLELLIAPALRVLLCGPLPLLSFFGQRFFIRNFTKLIARRES